MPQIDLNEKNDESLILPNKKKIKRSSYSLTHNSNNIHVTINCDDSVNLFRSNDNLPKINIFFDKNALNSSKKKERTNSFLKSNHKPLNPVKIKKTITSNFTDQKKYLLNSNKKDDFKPKEELKSMKKSLFFEKPIKKSYMKQQTVEIMNSNDKIKLSDYIPNLATYENYNKDEINHEVKEKIPNNRKSSLYKSKGKAINNLVGKKLYIPNKRNLSNNQIKKVPFQ